MNIITGIENRMKAFAPIFFAIVSGLYSTVYSITAHSKTWESTDASQIDIHLGYTFGTHDLQSKGVRAKLTQSGDSLETVSGEIVVPIESIKEGNKELECHARESLGLNYAVSDFPNKHVCEREKLPDSGKNAIAYPEIKLRVNGLETTSEAGVYRVKGEWEIHGVTRLAEDVKIKIEQKESESTATGSTKFKLKDFGIVVKNAFVVSVKDEASVNFKLVLRKTESP